MQNHIPYDDRYRDPLPVTGPDGQAMPDAGQYLRGLLHSDHALRRMVAGLERLPEPTALVLYGDHLPGTWPEPVRELNGRFVLRQTPYLVWSNTGDRRVDQPFTGPVHFTDLLMEQLDAPVSPYLALLTLLRQEVPAMEGRLRYDASGQVLRAAELSPRARRLLHDYRLLQYDLVGGNGYSEATLLRPPPPR
jgi:Sulfatase